MGRLEGKVAVITGGSSGIGAATARLFAQEGARVVIADILDEEGQNLAKELGNGALYHHTNVILEDEVQAAVNLAVEKFGKLDCMFNNAGVGGTGGPIEETDTEGFDMTVAHPFQRGHAGNETRCQGYVAPRFWKHYQHRQCRRP